MKRLLLAALVACQSSPAPAPVQAPPVTPPAAPPATGTVKQVTFASAALGVDKQYVVYLPAGYDASHERYPVFYYLHGLGGNEDNWVKGGEIDKVADRLGLEAIIVMPDGDDSFYVNAVTPVDYDQCIADGTGLFLPGHESRRTSCVRHRDYETYIVKDLIDHVDATYRTIATRDGRAIAGLSMGGFGALELALRHRDLFAAAASHSGVDSLVLAGPFPYPAGHPDQAKLLAAAKDAGGPPEIRKWMSGLFGTDVAHVRELDPTTLAGSLQPGQLALYLDCGTEDDFGLNNHATYLHDVLAARGIEHVFFLGPGHHNFRFWTARLPESLAFLRAHTTSATVH
jgi:S-formylglutathione hydrolase FrmB